MRSIMSTRFLAFVVILGALHPDSLRAQARFEWPSALVDVSRYQTVDECLSATVRVNDSIIAWATVRSDTLPVTPQEATQRRPVPVVQTARRCSSRFSAAKVPIADWFFVFNLFLYAERYEAADSVLQHRLMGLTFGRTARDSGVIQTPGALHDSSVHQLRGAVLDSAITAHLRTKPVRFSVVDPLMRELIALPHTVVWKVANGLNGYLLAAREAMDTTRGRWAAEQFDVISKRITSRDVRDTMYRVFVEYYNRALDYQSRDALRDSLLKSTSGYAALRQTNWQKASTHKRSPLSIGRSAPVIHGDFWYDTSAGDTVIAHAVPPSPRPVPGRPSLVVMLTPKCRGYPWSADGRPHWACFQAYSVLRRLATRFPALDITIVSQTLGAYDLLPPLQPAAEAELLSRWWQGYHRLHGTLAVTRTAFWRISDPDRRKILEPTRTEQDYRFGAAIPLPVLQAFLIDADGIIVDGAQLTRHTERDWNDLLEILARR